MRASEAIADMPADLREIMPFINSRAGIPMTEQQKVSQKERLGDAIAMIPGKSEQWLLLGLKRK